jgi:hypothetical protein
MEWMRKIEKYLSSPQASARKALDALVTEIANAHRETELSTSAMLKQAKAHLTTAEYHYSAALAQFKNRNYSESQNFSKQCSVYLQLAVSHANSVVTQEITLAPPAFSFPHSSAEFVINELLDSIVGTKMAIETGNYKVRPKVQKLLIRVVKMARLSLIKLEGQKSKEAKSLALAALFLLASVLQSLTDDNGHSALKTDLFAHMDADLKNYSLVMRDFIGRMAAVRNALSVGENAHSKKIEKHIDEAEKCFEECVAALQDGKVELLATLTASVTVELKLGEQLLLNSVLTTPMDLNMQSSEQSNPSRKIEEHDDEFSADKAFQTYFRTVTTLIEIAEDLSMRDLKKFESKISLSVGNFRDAAYHYKYGNYQDAERLTQRAYSELDFARQIATTIEEPRYRQLEI